MYNTDNVLYLPKKNIDIRICPKNAFSSTSDFYLMMLRRFDKRTLREIYNFRRKKSTRLRKKSWRLHMVYRQGDQFDIPFRKNSIRFAIKRDPVERFESAVSYKRLHQKYDTMSDLLTELENGKFIDVHLCTQSYFMGRADQYSYVYDINEYEEFLKHIVSLYDLFYVREKFYMRKNVSARHMSIEELQDDIDKGGRIVPYGPKGSAFSFQDPLIMTKTEEDVARIKELYKIDYENGWC